MLEDLGFSHVKVYIKGRNLSISYYPDLKLFHGKIGFSITRQNKKLDKLLTSYKRLPLRYKFSRAKLDTLYWNDELSLPKIAKKLGVSASGIHKLVQRYGISRRPAGAH